jgi:hypothetical protein
MRWHQGNHAVTRYHVSGSIVVELNRTVVCTIANPELSYMIHVRSIPFRPDCTSFVNSYITASM